MGIVRLGLNDDFDWITSQTQTTAFQSLQLSFVDIPSLILKHISAFLRHEEIWLATNKDRYFQFSPNILKLNMWLGAPCILIVHIQQETALNTSKHCNPFVFRVFQRALSCVN